MTHANGAADGLARYKQRAAERAVELVQSGMVVGLGTGSTAVFAVRRLAELLRDGALRDIVGIPTSAGTAAAARSFGVPLLADDGAQDADLTIDGADEVDPALDLIKGGGGALLREKIVAQASRRCAFIGHPRHGETRARCRLVRCCRVAYDRAGRDCGQHWRAAGRPHP